MRRKEFSKESFAASVAETTNSGENSSLKQIDESSGSDLSLVLNSQEANDLYEKIISLIFRLMWDGVSGSNEEAWKDRCQIFSSLNRLAKDFILIKPLEFIELHLVEMCLQRLISDSKKDNKQ